MTNKEKAFYIINKYISQNKSKYIALLYIRDDGSFRFDIRSSDCDDRFNNLINYINNLGDNLFISDNEKIMSITGFNDVEQFGIILVSLYYNKFDNDDIWGVIDDK